MKPKHLTLAILIGKLWLALAELSGAYGQQWCPDGNCPQPQWQPRQQVQASPVSDHHAGIVKVSIGNAGGTGTLIYCDTPETGIVLTAWHVIEGQGQQGTLRWPSGETTGFRIVGAEEGPDLAVLRCYLPKQYAVVPLAEVDEYAEAGETVEVCGYRATYRGRMCHFFAKVSGYATRDSERHDQISVRAQTVSGDSGGPIIYRGKVVAVLWGFEGGVDGTPAITHGACCVRIRSFLDRFRCRPPAPRPPPQPPVLPGPVDAVETPPEREPIAQQPACQCPPHKPCNCDPEALVRLETRLETVEALHTKLDALLAGGKLKGEKGEQGPAGERGPQGPAGPPAKESNVDVDVLVAEVIRRLPPQPVYFQIRPRQR